MKIEVAPSARGDLAELTEWWDANRPAARVRVANAFADALAGMAAFPSLGAIYEADSRYRTWPIKGTPYAAFYLVDDDVIKVAAVWSLERGEPPLL